MAKEDNLIGPGLMAEVLALKQGNHLCLVYEDDPAEQLPAILPFMRQGLESGEQCLYVADDYTLDQFSSALAEYGIDVDAETKSGALLLWTRSEWRQPGDLDSSLKGAQVRSIIDAALASGFKGIRAGVEMTWTLGPDLDVERLRHWEATINTIFTPEIPGRIVCQYSRKRLSPAVIHAGLATHPLAILGTDVCLNPFYEAPLILDGNEAPTASAARVDWMLSQLHSLNERHKVYQRGIGAEAALLEAQRSARRIEGLLVQAHAIIEELRGRLTV